MKKGSCAHRENVEKLNTGHLVKDLRSQPGMCSTDVSKNAPESSYNGSKTRDPRPVTGCRALILGSNEEKPGSFNRPLLFDSFQELSTMRTPATNAHDILWA